MTARTEHAGESQARDALSARGLLNRLIVLYLIGTTAAIAVTILMFLLGIEFTLRQWLLFLPAVPFMAAPMVIADVLVIRWHYRPVRRALEALDGGVVPSRREAANALVRLLDLPIYSFFRIVTVHGPTVGVTLVLGQVLLNRWFDGGFAAWQIATTVFVGVVFSSPSHAIIEFFQISKLTRGAIERVARHGSIDEADRPPISVRLSNKLIYLSVFVAALPLTFFTVSIIFKVDLMFVRIGADVSLSDQAPLLLWIASVVFVLFGGALGMSILTARDVSRSARKLISAMREVEAGHLERNLRITSTDEYAELFQGFNKMTESLREEVRILEISHDLAGELDLDRLLVRIVGAATELLDAERSSLFLYDAKTDELWSPVAEGEETNEIRFPAGEGVAGDVLRSGQAANVSDVYADPRFNKAVDQQTGFRTRSILCMPIVNKAGETIGVTQVLNKRGDRFRSKDEARLGAFNAQIAVALENAQLFEDVFAEKAYNDSILRSSSDGILTFDTSNVCITANETALRILGMAERDVVGQPVSVVFYDSWVRDIMRGMLGDSPGDIVVDQELTLEDDSVAAVNMSVMPLVDAGEERIGSMMVIQDITSEKRVRSTMSRYMSAEVVEQLLESGEAQLGGADQHVSILFSDVRGFTTVSEQLGARETVSMLNEYFEEMVEVIFRNNGVLDKFIGDAIMALYGVPFNGEQDADNAVDTACQMFTALWALNETRAARGVNAVEIGIGISTGDVIVGNIGSTRRMEYTVIGDSVNLAARLESATKYYGAQVLLSEFTVADLKQHHSLREIDLLRVKGKTEPVTIFEAMDHRTDATFPSLAEALTTYAEATAALKRRDWQAALAGFEAVLGLHPGDGPSAMHRDRVRHYIANPPPDDWNGVWTMESK